VFDARLDVHRYIENWDNPLEGLCSAWHADLMHRTTVVIDEKKLAKARRLLRTKSIKDTIERALDEVIAMDARRSTVEQLQTMEGIQLDDPGVMSRAWRSGTSRTRARDARRSSAHAGSR